MIFSSLSYLFVCIASKLPTEKLIAFLNKGWTVHCAFSSSGHLSQNQHIENSPSHIHTREKAKEARTVDGTKTLEPVQKALAAQE